MTSRDALGQLVDAAVGVYNTIWAHSDVAGATDESRNGFLRLREAITAAEKVLEEPSANCADSSTSCTLGEPAGEETKPEWRDLEMTMRKYYLALRRAERAEGKWKELTDWRVFLARTIDMVPLFELMGKMNAIEKASEEVSDDPHR